MEKQNKFFIFFGDSISFGELISIHKIWVSRLSKLIEDNLSTDSTVMNLSINGNTTRMALERIPSDVQKYRPKVVNVQFGMNDCNYWLTDEGQTRVSISAYRENLKEIVSRCFRFGAEYVLLPTSHPTPHLEKTVGRVCYEESRQAFCEMVREICEQDDRLILVDIEKVFNQAIKDTGSCENYLMADGIHLNESGHQLYYDTYEPVILEICRKIDQK